MVLIISDKVQQNKIKELVLPIFAATEQLLQSNKLKIEEKNKIRDAVIDLNKLIFKSANNVPCWVAFEIQESLNKLINVIPRKQKDQIPYQQLKEYLAAFSKDNNIVVMANQSQNLLSKIKQILGISARAK